MPSLEEILQTLRRDREELSRLGALRLAVFGSFARGDATPESDLDLLVDLDRRTFYRYMTLKLHLEDLFQKSVDLVLSDSIKPQLRDRILAEAVDAA